MLDPVKLLLRTQIQKDEEEENDRDEDIRMMEKVREAQHPTRININYKVFRKVLVVKLFVILILINDEYLPFS